MKLYPATIGQRLGAFVLDYFIMTSAFVAMFPIILEIDKWSEKLSIALFIIVFLLFLFYIPLCETFFHGQTIGKKALRIRTVRTDGNPATGVHCLQRFMILPIDLGITFGAGGLISALVTSKRQRMGDLFADTMVIKDAPHQKLTADIYNNFYFAEATPQEKAYLDTTNINQMVSDNASPLAFAEKYRDTENQIAYLRTHKYNNRLIDYMERLYSYIHVHMFQHKSHTFKDLLVFTLRGIPRAVYEARWSVLAALVIAVLAWVIGAYSQSVEPEFFHRVFGHDYTSMTINNIEKGDPMGVYGQESEWRMFGEIFQNNFLVTCGLYFLGIFTFIGPLFMLVNNFVRFGAFDQFFFQYGLYSEALIATNEHGVLELSSIIMVAGAAIHLTTGFFFPGKLSRLKGLARSARQSALILLSAMPMILIAAIIESFVTRHVEWPMSIKLAIIILSSIIIIGYYVMLPIWAKRQ